MVEQLQVTSRSSEATPLPRGLILVTCLWISGAWLQNIGIQTPIQPVEQEYTYGLQMLCCSLMLGILLGWPLMRLSVTRFVKPIRQTMLDMGVVSCGVLVTIWPLRLLSAWSVEQTALLTGILVAWVAVAGVLVCLGASSRSGLLRGGLILMLFTLVGLEAVLPDSERMHWWRPIDLVLRFTEMNASARSGDAPDGALSIVAQTFLVGCGAWLLAVGWRFLRRDSGESGH